VPLVLAVMSKYFPAVGASADYCNTPDFYDAVNADTSLISEELAAKLEKTGKKPSPGDVKYIFHTKSGPGPLKQPIEESLLDPATGLPVPPSAKHKRLQISKA
jgi:hypothetical protein